MPRANRQRGYSLIELLAVLAILGILTGLVMPGYQHYVRKARRGDAELSLQLLRQAMERHYSAFSTYRHAAETGDTGIPRIFHSQSPAQGAVPFYHLRISRANVHCFELLAEPATGSSQDVDVCGTLYLNYLGQKGSASDDGQCWNGTNQYQGLTEEQCGN